MFPYLFPGDKGDCTVTFNFAFIPGINVLCILCLFPGVIWVGDAKFRKPEAFISGKQTKDTSHLSLG